MGVTRSTRALPAGAREEAEARQTVIRGALRELRVDVMLRHRPMDIDHWERTRGKDVVRVVAQAQYDNAELVQLTHGMILTAQGYQLEPLGHIRPGAFSGRMPDGDPLDIIPAAVANRVRERLATGSTPLRAWQAGGELLATITQTALSDTSRMAKMVAGLATPRTLYVRILTPPSCSMCAVLAGKKDFWDQPFQRHPVCDCSQIPVPMDSDDTWEGPEFDGMAFFNSLSEHEQNKYFTRSGAAAIREGADLAQVVNARSGMRAVGDRYTRAGATRRGRAIQYHVGTDDVPHGTPAFDRLSVPQIIRQTEGDPQRRIGQLYRHGYITSVPPGRRLSDVLDEVNNNRGPRRARGVRTSAAARVRPSDQPPTASMPRTTAALSNDAGRMAQVNSATHPSIPNEVFAKYFPASQINREGQWRRRLWRIEGREKDKLELHEWATLIRLAENGHEVVVLPRSNTKSPDALVDGMVYDVKAPSGGDGEHRRKSAQDRKSAIRSDRHRPTQKQTELR